MAHLVRNAEITSDCWQLLESAEALAAFSSEPAGFGALLPLQLWIASRESLQASPVRLGVLLQGHDDPQVLARDLARLDLIAVRFARFTDGRGYSIARQLRGRYGYRGELRAVGDVMLDQLFYLMRVGFDAYALRDDQDPGAAAAALRSFSMPYQAGADHPLPLFRRRLEAA